jgi:hypothetical protein
MQESYGEGVASHTGPESCVQYRKVRNEALTGVRAGEAIEPRNEDPVERRALQGADALEVGGRPHAASRQRETCSDPARSKTHRTLGNLTHGNWEVPRASAIVVADRIGKSKDVRR